MTKFETSWHHFSALIQKYKFKKFKENESNPFIIREK